MSTAPVSASGSAGAKSATLHCMEILGGSQETDRRLDLPGLDIWIHSEPFEHAEQGGDVHYVSLCGGGKITRAILADVSGHGANVAEFSSRVRGLLRRNVNRPNQTGLVRALNREFSDMAEAGRFATAVVATHVADRHQLTVSNAGHPRPLWYRAKARAWAPLAPEVAAGANLPLGVDNDAPYEQFRIPMATGDLIVLYTDALIEAADPAGQMLGEAGLRAIAERLDPSDARQFGTSLLAEIQRHRAGRPAEDDLTLLVLRSNGTGPRPPGPGELARMMAKMVGLVRI